MTLIKNKILHHFLEACEIIKISNHKCEQMNKQVGVVKRLKLFGGVEKRKHMLCWFGKITIKSRLVSIKGPAGNNYETTHTMK